METYDAILIPGGGVRAGGELPSWTRNRLDLAIRRQPSQYFIALSAGTTHKPPPLDEKGHPIFESVAAAHYLVQKGINPQKILVETSSYDTIGNVFFSRVIHVEPLSLKNLLIVTSDFHMPRTKIIFKWIYQLEGLSKDCKLSFEGTPDGEIDEEALEARKKKEKQSLQNVQKLIKEIRSVKQFHAWLFNSHKAYSVIDSGIRETGEILKSY